MQLGGIQFNMSIFAVPNASDMQDLFTIFRFSNNAAGGSMFLAIMGVVWTVALIGSLANGRKFYRGFIFANFISAILSVILALLGVLNRNYMYFFILMLAFGIVWAKLAESKG